MSEAERLLREVATQCNNIIMKGSYSGDDIHEASKVMQLCINIVTAINEREDEQKDK